MSSGIGNATPGANQGGTTTQVGGLERIGSGADGTEGAAEDFTNFLENEDGASERRSTPKVGRREAPDRSSGPEQRGEDGRFAKRQPESRERAEPRKEARKDGRQADPDERDEDPFHDPVLEGRRPPQEREEADEGEDEADPAEDDADDETGERDEGEDDEDEDPEHEVKIRGVTHRVRQSELIQGYQREADYRQKTQALSQDRQQVEGFAQQVQQRAGVLDRVIQTYQDLINAVMPSESDWNALKASDPQAYIRAQEQWNGFLQQMQQAKADRETLTNQGTEEQIRQRNEYMRSENAKLMEALPALADKAVQKQFSDAIFGYGRKMGYTNEEMAQGLVNHRDVMTAYYAAKYLELMESRQANRQKANKAKPRTSEGTQNVRTPQTPRGRRFAANRGEQRRADRQLERTGSMESAASSFAAMFRE